LAQIQELMDDAVQAAVINEFRQSSWVLDRIPFVQAVNPAGPGATLTYGYNRVTTYAAATTRALNAEYTAQEAATTRYTTDLAIFGGAYQIDRVIAKLGQVDQVAFQAKSKIDAAVQEFHYLFVQGDTAVDSNGFDGLDAALTGSSTEWNATVANYVDLSSSADMDTNYKTFLDSMDMWLALLTGKPDALLVNSKMQARLRGIGRRAGYYSQSEDAFGRPVDHWDGIPFIDLGDYAYLDASGNQQTGQVIPVETRSGEAGLTDIYAVQFAEDKLHAVGLADASPINSWLPDFSTAGAVKTGEVEMVASIALKATKAAGVFRNVKVTETTGGIS
jgi:hypothetical protein